MEEIVKHINDTNASYRTPNAGDAKNTDLFLDNEHYELFHNAGEQITVRFNKENLQKAILFIASILPRKYDNSSVHRIEPFTSTFVFDQLAFLDAFFTVNGDEVESRTQIWNLRKDIPKKNGDIDSRFYFNGLLEEIAYTNSKGEPMQAKFTIRNYLAGGYSDLHIKKAENGIFDVWITNTLEYKDDGRERQFEEIDAVFTSLPLQQIYYGAPGTGKSHTIKEQTKNKCVIRTTFHPDSDYSTFVGAYKPTMVEKKAQVVPIEVNNGIKINQNNGSNREKQISYQFVIQAFLKAYLAAWKKYTDGGLEYAMQTPIKADNNYTPFANILSKQNLISELICLKETEKYACHKFGAKFWKSLKNLSSEDIKDIIKKSDYGDDSKMDTEVRKGMAVGEWIENELKNNRILPNVEKEETSFHNMIPPQFLIIEEINRGNCAQIFGDLFQLLDRGSNGFSEYPIEADTDLQQEIEQAFNEAGEYQLDNDINVEGVIEDYTSNYGTTLSDDIQHGRVLLLPNNLYIWATMNTSDQSLFPMDSAFKRRWSWKCVPIDYNNKKSGGFSITIGNNQYNWHQFLKSVNERIVKATDSEDKQMGNFFINGNVDERLFIDKVMFYLWNDICKEEYHTKNNFFRYFTDEKKTETEEFTFNALFESDAQKLLKGFMNYLGVEGVKLEQSKQQMEELTQNTENITVEEEPITESDNE